jgi:hypothetical protein
MPADLPIRCSCGALRGVARGVSGACGNRVVCYCDDCQSFAHFLDRAEDTLDAHGGTEIFQTSPARIEITAGADRLACMRLTPKGLLRWYAACCRTPIGNTLASRQVPFVGLVVACLDHPSLDSALGPIRVRGHARFAVGTPAGAHRSFPATAIARLLWNSLVARLRGDHRRSPFFDRETGAPVSAPRVLSAAERAAVRTRRGLS